MGTRGYSFKIGGSEKFKFASGGDTGINVSNPGSRLAIYDADGDNLLLASHNYSGETRIGFTGNTGTGGTNVDGATTGAIGVTASAPGGAATGYMSLYTNSGDDLEEKLRIHNDGILRTYCESDSVYKLNVDNINIFTNKHGKDLDSLDGPE